MRLDVRGLQCSADESVETTPCREVQGIKHSYFHSRSFPKPIERIESLRSSGLRFRVPLGSDGVHELEIVR